MSAKLLYSLSDDKKVMKNQSHIGCMNGLFQLFDRHHFMGGRRVNHKRLPPPGDNQQTQMEMENASCKANVDNSRQDTKDKHRESCESPQGQGSSSAFSSTHTFSNSVKTASPRAASATASMSHAENRQSPKLSRGSDHLLEIVKESNNREVPGLLVKTPVGKGILNVVKHIDSPRPPLPLTPIKSKSSGLDESFKKLGRFQEIQNEGKDRSLVMTRREGHRFSCDGRVTNSQETLKSTLKLREQPRLSLDGRASSKGRMLENDNYMSPKLEKPDSRNHTSIVAKLMGLEISHITTESTVPGKSSESNEASNPDSAAQQTVASSFCKDPIKNTVQLRNRDASIKPISASRLLVEPAPWKDASSSLRKPGFGEATKNIPNVMPSVYGEMEKRVTELEFTKSSSDLRALQQILGAMRRSKDSLQIKKELASDSVSQSGNQSILCRSHCQEVKSADSLTLSGNFFQSVKSDMGRHQKKNAAPALLMKPAHAVRDQQIKLSAERTAEGFSGLQKLKTPNVGGQNKESIEKYTPSGRTLRDASSPTLHTFSNSIASPRKPRLINSKLTQPQATEKNSAIQSSGVVSPRLQRQLKFDKKVQQTSPPSESTRIKEQPTDSNLQRPWGKLADVRIKSSSGIQLDSRSRSDSNVSQSSQFATEGTNMAYLDMMEASFLWKRHIKQDNKSARSDKCRAIAEINIIAPEQPSPVSVLDAMFYREDSPSPVKKISNVFIDDEYFNQEEQAWATKHGKSDSTTSLASTDYDTERVYNREELSEEQLNFYSTTVGKLTDCSLPLEDVKDQDHEYTFEDLLASRLFQESRSALKTIQSNQSGCSGRPGIFKILEMKNAKQYPSVNTLKNDTVSKQLVHAYAIQRKLIFDIVNEILSSKLLRSSYNELLSSRVADKSQAKQKLLKDIHSEINQLQVIQSYCNNEDDYDKCLKSIMLDDMQKHGPNRSKFQDEISALVLDVERLIFKDLIGEIISDAAEGSKIRNSSANKKVTVPKKYILCHPFPL